MVRTVPPSFVEIGPKLRVVAPLKWEWPKTAKNRGEPQKMTPSSETEFFFGWFRWESCSPGYSGHLISSFFSYELVLLWGGGLRIRKCYQDSAILHEGIFGLDTKL